MNFVDRLKAKQKEREESSKKTENNEDDSVWWRTSSMAKDNESISKQKIRFHFPEEDASDFAVEVPLHFNIPTKPQGVLCLKHFGEDCPVCEMASSLWKAYAETADLDKNGKVVRGTGNLTLKKKAISLFANKHHIAKINLRDQEVAEKEDEVRLWRMSDNQYKQVFKLIADEEEGFGNILDPNEGFDVTIKLTPKGVDDNKTMYPVYSLSIPRTTKASPIFKDKKRQTAFLEALANIDIEKEIMDLYRWDELSEEKLEQVFSDEEDPSDEKGSEYNKESSEENDVDNELARLRRQTGELDDSDIPF